MPAEGWAFTFEVPTGEPIVRYSASAYQRYHQERRRWSAET
jgi:hypothetical protein